MPNMEKVIKGLECCTAYYIDNDLTGHERCPYNGRNGGDGCSKLYADALALLKDQKAVERTYRTGINGFNVIWTCGACGSDLHPNNAKAKYCSNCGQAVKWELTYDFNIQKKSNF